MEPTDLTLRVLEEIRDEVRSTRESLTERIDVTNARIDATNDGLRTFASDTKRSFAQLQMRLSTELVGVPRP